MVVESPSMWLSHIAGFRDTDLTATRVEANKLLEQDILFRKWTKLI